jgi:signal transduction histidine kinase
MGHRRIIDIAAMALAGLLTLTNLITQFPPVPEPYDVVVFLLLMAGAGALWFRRQAPVVVAWLMVALAAVLVAVVWVFPTVELRPETTLLPAAAPIAAYNVGVHARGRWPAWLPLVVMSGVACLATASLVAVVARILMLVAAPAVLGMYVAARREQLEYNQEQARVDERLRLAADIHDVVSNRVTAMVLQAGALQLTADNEATRQAAGDLRATGSRALAELRDLVGLLSDPGRPQQTDIRLDLTDLVAESESIGMPVEVAESGEPRPLAPAVGRTAYRVVQESLTNARKHAPGSRVRLEICYVPQGLTVSVHNTAATGPDGGLTGSGSGLLGLRRRIELLDGTLSAQPNADGGFRVEASLPSP